MGLYSLTNEELLKIIQATYEYWDGYYIPDNSDPEGWTNKKVVDSVRKTLNKS